MEGEIMTSQQKKLCQLQDALVSMYARHIAKTTGPDKGPMDWYRLPDGKIIIVHIHSRGGGYEVYAPIACDTMTACKPLS